MGTPSYMAPEQAEGRKDVGPPADIYALGAILYQLLTGEPPFQAETPLDTILKVLADEPVPPRRLVPGVPRDLETICLKCLQKAPVKRYAEAADLAEDLRRFLQDKPIRGRRVGRWEKTWRWCRLHPVASVLITGIVVGLVFTSVQQYIEYAGAVADLPSLLEAQKSRQPIPPAPVPNPPPRPAWHHARTLTGHESRVLGVAFHPGGGRLASCGEDQTVRIWDVVKGREERKFTGHTDTVYGVGFSPDGVWLASAGADRVVKIWDAATGAEVRSLEGHRHSVHAVAFSPCGRYLASASRDTTVVVRAAGTWEVLQTLPGHTRGVNHVAFSPDGELLASAGDDRTVKVWKAATGALLHTLTGHTDRVTGVCFAPDGRRLYSVGWDAKMLEWDVSDGKQMRQVAVRTRTGLRLNAVAHGPDGHGYAVAGWDPQLFVGGEETASLTGHTDMVTSVAFSADGRQLASASWDRSVRVWEFTATPATAPARGGRAGPNGKP
jgi:WD40 repeat protein